MSDSISPDALATLSSDLKDVNPNMPVLKADIYTLAVSEIALVPSKNKPGKTNLQIKLKTTEDSVDTDNKHIGKGWTITHTISVDKTDRYDPAPALKRFRTAVTGEESGAFMPLEQYKDKLVKARVTVQGERPEKDESGNLTGRIFPPSNTIAAWA